LPLPGVQDLSWQDDAACLGMFQETGEDLFFPPFTVGRIPAGQAVRIKKAKKVCGSCPVIRQCLRYAVLNECTGVWGGTTDSERKHIRK
jgi:WhiB family redox-sensing transcriptional regulator